MSDPAGDGFRHLETSGLAAVFAEWKEGAAAAGVDLKYFCGVDVGGTNTRVAIASNVPGADVVQLPKRQIRSTRTLVEHLTEVGAAVAEAAGGVASSAGAIDVAGPILEGGTKVNVTNYDPSLAPEHHDLLLSELPETLFPAGSARFLNDLESACYGVVRASGTPALEGLFEVLQGEPLVGGNTLPTGNALLCAMGTGLGIGLLVYSQASGEFSVLPMEGGHGLAYSHGPQHPTHDRDEELFNFMSDRLYDGLHGMEWEDICSGRGLLAAYDFFTRDAADSKVESEDAAAVAAAAQAGDNEAAKNAMTAHYGLLMRHSVNLMVMLNCDTLILAGDNQVFNRDFVVGNWGDLYAEFLTHPRQTWVETSTVLQQKETHNLNLDGCLFVAGQMIGDQ